MATGGVKEKEVLAGSVDIALRDEIRRLAEEQRVPISSIMNRWLILGREADALTSR